MRREGGDHGTGHGVPDPFSCTPSRHPNADRPLVDWDLILIMEPLTIGGALAGGFVNKVRLFMVAFWGGCWWTQVRVLGPRGGGVDVWCWMHRSYRNGCW